MSRRVGGEGTITRRKDGRWEGKIRGRGFNDEALRKSFYGKTRQEVAEQIRAYRVRHSSGATIDLTTAEYLTQWIADGKGEWRPNTYRLRSGTTIRHIVPYIGSRLVADLDVDDVKLLLRKLKERDVGAATRKQAHATLNAALNVLYRERKLLFNPCSLVRAPRYEPEEKIVLDRNQAMRLIAKAEGQVLVLIVMAATLALREGELFGLLWNCVDLKAGTVTIVRQLAEDLDGNLVLSPLKTKASRRTLELPKLARRALQLLRETRRGEPANAYVFVDGEGKPLRKSNFIRRDFKPLLVKAKLPEVAFHSLRHSSNSFLIEEGADPLLVAKRNGHSSTRMVLDRYGHLFEGARRQAALTMDRVFAKATIGRQMVVKPLNAGDQKKTPIPKSLLKSAFDVVEVRRLELLTPYMRSKCSTS